MRVSLLRFAAAGLLLAGCSGKSDSNAAAKAAAQPPRADILLGPYVTAVTDTSAKVLWVTEPGAGDSTIDACAEDRAPEQGNFLHAEVKAAPLPDQTEVLHTATLTNLQPGRNYTYWIKDSRGVVPGRFRTAPAPGAQAPVKFIVYGDSRSFPERHLAVAEAIRGEPPFAFVIHTGDLVSNGMMWEQWKGEFFEPAGELLREAAIWPVRGNHEGDAATYGDLFAPLPTRGLYYSFDWGDAHFAVLDSGDQEDSPDPNMLEWLRKDLAASKARWKFAAYHKPTIDTTGHGGAWGRDDVWPILQRHGADFVFCGHAHVYERFRPIGRKGAKPVIQIVTGGGGAPPYECRPGPALEAGYDGMHYCVVELIGDTFRMAVKTPYGDVIDRLEVRKTPGGMFDANTMDRSIPEEEAWEAALPPAGTGSSRH